MYMLTFVIPDDNAHAKEPNSGQDALNNAACVGAASPTNGEDGQCRPNPDEAKRPNAGWLAVKIAVKAQGDASQGGSTEPQSNVDGIHRSNLAEAATGQKAHAVDCGAQERLKASNSCRKYLNKRKSPRLSVSYAVGQNQP